MNYRNAALVILSLAAIPAFAKVVHPVHVELCKAAVESYPQVFADLNACVADTELETTSAGSSISFTSCETGEYVTLEFDDASGEISEGSSGAECD